MIRRISTVIALAVLLAVVLAVNPTSYPHQARAYTPINCKLPTTSPTYRFSTLVTTTYRNATTAGAGRWNAASVPVDFTLVTGSSSNILIDEASIAGQTYWAVTSGACSNGVRVGTTTVLWNTPLYMGPTTATGRRTIATHELGHVLGLNHSPTTSCGGAKAVMVQGTLKYSCGWGTEPWSDDINGINFIY